MEKQTRKEKKFSEELLRLSDKIMEIEAYIEFLEDALEKHLTPETRELYTKRLKNARNTSHKLEKKFRKLLEED